MGTAELREKPKSLFTVINIIDLQTPSNYYFVFWVTVFISTVKILWSFGQLYKYLNWPYQIDIPRV